MLYIFDDSNTHENEKYFGENRMITWFLKINLFIENIGCAILLIY